MVKTFQLVLLLVLSCALWMGADSRKYPHTKPKCTKKGGCCETCPNGWTRLDDRCYLFHSQHKNWCEAESSCIAEGGNLASFHNVKELEEIKTVVKKIGNSVNIWLGGYDAVKEGSWKFSDGTKCEFKDWTPETPNYPDKEDCMELKKGESVIDALCKQKRAYVCSTNLIVQY